LAAPSTRFRAIAHGVLQGAALPVVQNLMSRRLANKEDRFVCQRSRPSLVESVRRAGMVQDQPRHPGWLAPPASPSVVRTTPACRRWSARPLRTGRFAVARGGVPTRQLIRRLLFDEKRPLTPGVLSYGRLTAAHCPQFLPAALPRPTAAAISSSQAVPDWNAPFACVDNAHKLKRENDLWQSERLGRSALTCF